MKELTIKEYTNKVLGCENIARAFLNHGGLHVQLLDIDFTKKKTLQTCC